MNEGDIRAIEAYQILREWALRDELKEIKRPLRVAFMLPETSLWDAFEPVYRAMDASLYFDPFVLAFKRADILSEKSSTDIDATLKKMDVRFTLLEPNGNFYPPLTDYKPDIAFFTLGSTAYPPAYQIEFVSRFCLTCYISYGFLLVNEPEYQFGQSFHHAAWRIFASTPRESNEYAQRSRRATNNIVTTGYTKFDLYRYCSATVHQRPRIIWAPHWTIGLIYPALNLGTFAEICNDMLFYMQERQDIDFLFKPHPNLKYACEKTTFMSQDVYEGYLEKIRSLPNATVHLDGGNIERFVNSSAMITDSVSFLAEYLPSRRPLLFLERPDRSVFSHVGEEVIKAHYRGNGIAAIKLFVENVVLRGMDPQAGLRKLALESELNIGVKTATENILENLAISLELN